MSFLPTVRMRQLPPSSALDRNQGQVSIHLRLYPPLRPTVA